MYVYIYSTRVRRRVWKYPLPQLHLLQTNENTIIRIHLLIDEVNEGGKNARYSREREIIREGVSEVNTLVLSEKGKIKS